MSSSFVRVREYSITDCFPHAITASWGPVCANFLAPGYAFDESTVLFGAFSPLPSAKLVAIRRREPFQIVFRYAAPPAGSDAFVARLVVLPTESDFATDPVVDGRVVGEPKIKAKIALDENGSVEVRFVRLFTEVETVCCGTGDAAAAKECATVDGISCKDGCESCKDGACDTKDGEAEAGDVSSKKSEESAASSKDKENETLKAVAISKEGAKPKKTKTITRDIKFELIKPGPTEEEIQEMEALEGTMLQRDAMFVKLGEMTNDLERLALEVPSKVKAEWVGFISTEEEEALLTELQADERWLYSPHAESVECLPELESKLVSAKRQIEVVLSRIREVEEAKRRVEEAKLRAEEQARIKEEKDRAEEQARIKEEQEAKDKAQDEKASEDGESKQAEQADKDCKAKEESK